VHLLFPLDLVQLFFERFFFCLQVSAMLKCSGSTLLGHLGPLNRLLFFCQLVFDGLLLQILCFSHGLALPLKLDIPKLLELLDLSLLFLILLVAGLLPHPLISIFTLLSVSLKTLPRRLLFLRPHLGNPSLPRQLILLLQVVLHLYGAADYLVC